ncbi:hypothetical protein FLK61_35140 [Paenalkalicoccus suaedae]|uniref:DUF3168 domain-containing protein n=1 Tax=Paenalkalicoccus suaedae TaxID=2592382 RepID=A0A859FI57_9BACI|nr:hypothetical protein [Paenalkalicoccus suaedae]QKS71905.1 hypothetical protein FLK61_35140 [Paenalkalicoccus suaedae]
MIEMSAFIRDWMKEHVESLEGRVYRVRSLPNTNTPYVVMYLINEPRGSYDSKQQQYQFTIFGTEYGSTRACANELKDAIEKLNEDQEQGLHNGIFQAYVDSDNELYDRDSGLHQIPIDGVFHYQYKQTWG